MLEGIGTGTIRYVYDFDDDCGHNIRIEKVNEAVPGVTYPRFLKANGACPPKDVSGSPGYAGFLVVLADPDRKQHDDMVRWSGGGFDPEDARGDIIVECFDRPAKRWAPRPAKPKAPIRKARDDKTVDDLFGFLTCPPNAEVATVHSKAMPAILLGADEWKAWMNLPWEADRKLRRSLPHGALSRRQSFHKRAPRAPTRRRALRQLPGLSTVILRKGTVGSMTPILEEHSTSIDIPAEPSRAGITQWRASAITYERRNGIGAHAGPRSPSMPSLIAVDP